MKLLKEEQDLAALEQKVTLGVSQSVKTLPSNYKEKFKETKAEFNEHQKKSKRFISKMNAERTQHDLKVGDQQKKM